ncbi:hypothetical protein [Aureivirga marina]|uniref:hypothetical protein n=1 Tax=Aureivirga marina TaxID=1182451 RepID=UPI0018CAF91B|nr:hypothetical protein [Aureivirga marina]
MSVNEKYQTILTIEISHEYFQELPANFIFWFVSDQTKKRLKKQHVIFKQIGNKLQLIAKKENISLENIVFYFRINDRFWQNYTSPKLFNHQKLGFLESDEEKDNFESKLEAEILNVIGKEDVEKEQTFEKNENFNQLYKKEEQFYLLNQTNNFDGICFLSKIDFSKEKHYKINLEERAIYWKYFIPEKLVNNYEFINIVAQKETVLFEQSQTEIPNMMCFVSKEKIKNSEIQKEIFHLKRNVNHTNRPSGIIMEYLPTPNRETIRKKDTENNEYIDIYVQF